MVDWTDTDSLYGARSLAEEWDKSFHLAGSTYHTELSSISLFVLLDLLGSAGPKVPSYWSNTHWAYKNMAALERRMRANSVSALKAKPAKPFLPDEGKTDLWWPGPLMQDDHVPFLKRGVEVLHIIPSPFPAVWHKMEDDGAHLDTDTVEDWSKITMAFIAEWMDLEGHIEIIEGAKKPEALAVEESGAEPKENGKVDRRKIEL